MPGNRETVLRDRIVVSNNVLHGKPRVANTRIQVRQILDLLAAGRTVAEIVSEDYFPDLEPTDVYACIAYASEVVTGEVVVAVA